MGQARDSLLNMYRFFRLPLFINIECNNYLYPLYIALGIASNLEMIAKQGRRAEEMAQQLRAYTALAEDRSSDPSACVR